MTAAESLVLAGVDPGSVRGRPIDTAAFAGDASHYLLEPAAVVIADSEAAVARVLAACTAEKLPVTFRSAGTSLSGQAGTRDVLMDVRRGFRGVEVLDDGARVRAAPGTTIRAVNAALSPFGRMLGPDPASEAACTVGGVVANNSSGMSCGTTGSAYRTLQSLRFILPSGTIVDTAESDCDRRLLHDEPDLYEGLLRLSRAVNDRASMRESILRLFAMKNTMGYGVNALIDFDSPAEMLAHLIVGSEGTLAFIASATFRTLPLRPYAATSLVLLPDLPSATDVLPALIESGATAIELLDARSLAVASQGVPALDALAGKRFTVESALLVEYQAETESELRSVVERAVPLLRECEPTSDAVVRGDLWRVRKGLYASVAGARRQGTTALLEDVAVPVPGLTATCGDLSELFARHGYDDAVIFGHAKDGNIHFMITEDFGSAVGVQRYAAFTEDMVDVVLARGGTLKAEHGTGRAMAPFVERQYGPDLYAVMREIKSLCDPGRILNPGVILTEDPDLHVRDLKTIAPVDAAVDRCVECGFCEPVCPSRDLTLTPRQRIVVQRASARLQASGLDVPARDLEADYIYDGTSTCAADGMCQTACPVGIDTGALARSQRARSHGRLAQTAGRLAASRWEGTTTAAAAASTIAHAAPRAARRATAVGRLLIGTDAMPLWSDDMPSGGARRRPRRGEAAGVVLIPSCMGRMFGGDDAADAFIALCHRAGAPVTVPDSVASLCCGMPWSSKGLTDGEAEMSARLRAALEKESTDRRITVLTDAASCSESLAKALSGDRYEVEDIVAFTARELLPRLTPRRTIGRLALHPTCASTRSGTNEALRQLAEAIAEDVFVPPSWGCCAFAGDRGLLHPELTESATLEQANEVRAYGADVHASCNRACELGLSRATGSQYRHIVVLLDEATR